MNPFRLLPTLPGILLLGLALVSSCQFDSNLSGNIGTAGNIEEAKRRGVFVREYETPTNPYVINDSITLQLEEAWLERKWFYASNLDETIIKNEGYRLSVKVSPPFSLKNYNKTWYIGDGKDRTFSGANRFYDLLTLPFESIPEDYEVFLVKEGTYLELIFNRELEQKNIGKFELVRKK